MTHNQSGQDPLIAAEQVELEAAVATFVSNLRAELASKWGERSCRITMARAGLESEIIWTLEALGHELNLTRERVRQLVRPLDDAARRALPSRSPLRSVVERRFGVAPGRAWAPSKTASKISVTRALTIALEALDYRRVDAGTTAFWLEPGATTDAFGEVLSHFDAAAEGASCATEIADRLEVLCPDASTALDLPWTIAQMTEALNYGPGLDGRFAPRHSNLVRRVASKIQTFLERRAHPISAEDLADVVRRGLPPFEPLHRPLITGAWMWACAKASPDVLRVLPDGRIALAEALAHRGPTGTVGIVHALLVENGEPMRMIDLCDQAAAYGLSRNQVGVLIHSGRAASLFMLDRGVVGLVGRDEDADSLAYSAAQPGRARRVRPGRELGLDDQGRLATDLVVRRSIREQGLGLPWPFSVVGMGDAEELQIDRRVRDIVVRANGDLDLPELEPGSTIRMSMERKRFTCRLWIETSPSTPLTTIAADAIGADIPVGLANLPDRPGWVQQVLDRADARFTTLADFQHQLPRSLTPKRRLYVLHAFVALGLVRPSPTGWAVDRRAVLPSRLAEAFRLAASDPRAYPAIGADEQRAAAWLVWAGWLVCSLGWTVVQPNDLGDLGDEGEPEDHVPASVNPREACRMRIAEAAHLADDMRKHPGDVGEIEATRISVRRYLTALGYTALRSVTDGERTRSGYPWLILRASNDGPATAVWLLTPLGSGATERELDLARRAARKVGAPTAVATDGLVLLASAANGVIRCDLRRVATQDKDLDRLASLGAEPDALLGVEAK